MHVSVHPAGQSFRVANDGGGLRRLKRLLGKLAVTRVVMEATSKYHRAAQRSLHEAGLAVGVVNPLRARLFAEACGQLAKTDRIDARQLAVMGTVLDPAETVPASLAMEALQEMDGARSAASAERTAHQPLGEAPKPLPARRTQAQAAGDRAPSRASRNRDRSPDLG
ncbi:MAG: IS110 family transposase [Mesorhizobium sp.]|nr:MAG: IS110 family transposase [Mesorhizobium sp.]TJW43615.1 MAG: IS110 family transposase [Mesorhizobium sp.]